MCLYPKIIKNKKYTSTKKNNGIIPAFNDERTKYVPIGCGNCMECRKQKAREWQVRLLEDIKTNTNGKFITLTFSNESIKELNDEIETLEGYERDNAIATLGVRRFLERWRKQYGKSLRHWLVTEIGHQGTENIHLHGIIWTNKTMEDVEKHWKYGWIWKGKRQEKNNTLINYVNEQTINYIIKYINKIDEQHTTFKSKVLTTPGIGSNYIKTFNSKNNIFKEEKTNETYKTRTGHKIALPIYWRNKIYTEEEREKLWIAKLNKEMRYVNGQKISIKNGEEKYWLSLKEAQKLNKELGYGDDTKDWSKTEYEKQRRILLIKQRVSAAQKELQ